MLKIQNFEEKKISKDSFLWRMSNGKMILVSEMDTQHLFNVLKMIWNNICPENWEVGDVRKYRFNSFYTQTYFLESFSKIMSEVSTRNDVPQNYIEQLSLMRAKFKRRISAVKSIKEKK